ncbi:MAG: S53 family peptidase [Candidatus Dormiibacterota bacterium]
MRPLWAILAAGFTVVALGGVGVQAANAPALSAIPGSYLPTNAAVTGQLQSPEMGVEVVLQPNNSAGLNSLLAGQYTPGSPQYGKWLAKGQFDTDFAPSAATTAAVTTYLESHGLAVHATSSPFLVRAVGSSAQIESTFSTPIYNYRSTNGTSFFSNAAAVSVPSTVAPSVLGVVGLSNTVRLQNSVQVAQHHRGSQPSCETPYPSNLSQLEAIFAGGAYGYGAGPNCTGLTPSQTNGIYNAPQAGPRAQGAGATLAVFELSAYNQSDITDWAQTMYGPHYYPRLTNINVDGGPLATNTSECPTGDTCIYGYGGDIEVEADIEQQLSISPDINQIQVYNAPNDYTGQTELDEYTQIANDDIADSVSSSWAVCEIDATEPYAQAENLVFEQMAAQGQSMFAAAGDTGAFSCIRDGAGSLDQYGLQVLDPGAQPWVTSVGGTSLETDNPGSNPHPTYPNGVESVWNILNLCNDTTTGLYDCAEYGAGGGGHSIFWGRPAYQRGPGVNNAYTVSGPANCALAAKGQPCREVPDVSANADELTGIAEYCSGSSYLSPLNPTGVPYASACAPIVDSAAPHWFQIGGTSLSSPLWSGILADRDAYQGYRSGNANYLLYALFNSPGSYSPVGYFHDITGFGQRENNNGYYPVTPGYDEATGIGTPNMSGLITGFRGLF